MKILYFGIYDPNYARNKVLISGLKENRVEVIECRASPKDKSKYLKLFWQFIKSPTFDCMIVGFPGQEVMFLARLLTFRPIIFDAFTSHYGGYILDRKYYSEKSWRAKYYRFLDTWSCKLAQLVLLDTNAHIEFFVKEFGLPRRKFRRIWIGADDYNFKPSRDNPMPRQDFKVIFFGTYVPLQGAEYIVRAAKLLEHETGISFLFIGKGQDKQKVLNLVDQLELKNIMFKDILTPEKLKLEIAKADISLGIFGDTPKTFLVIPNKIYEALAMRKPVITADTLAARELLSERDVFYVRPADPASLAHGIMALKNNPSLMIDLAVSGYNTFNRYASSSKLGLELTNIIKEIIWIKRIPKF